jgi:hypothetical protein
MGKKWIAINAVLLAIAGVLAWQLHTSVGRFNSQSNIGKVQPTPDVKQKLAQAMTLRSPAPPPTYTPSDFQIVPDQNIFSETRAREEKVEAAPVAPVVAELVAKPVLVGVTLSGSQRLALIIDPTAQGGGRRTQTKRIGDVYQGYTITDITESRMILEAGSRREVIPLHDGSKHQAQTGRTPILTTRVVYFGKGTAGGSPPGVQGVVTGGMAAPRPAGAAGGITPIGAGSAGTTTAGSATGIRTVPQQGRQGSAPSPQPPVANPQAPGPNQPPGSRVIRTPFGDIVRPDVPPNQ